MTLEIFCSHRFIVACLGTHHSYNGLSPATKAFLIQTTDIYLKAFSCRYCLRPSYVSPTTVTMQRQEIKEYPTLSSPNRSQDVLQRFLDLQ